MLGGQQSPRARQGVPEWHQSLENAVELGRSPGELNHIAELNCAHEPARRAGQHEPHLQTPCKRFQLHNLHTCGGAAKESMAGWYRRQRVLKHPCRTPWVQDLGLARGAWGSTASPNCTLFTAGKMDRERE